MICIFCNQDRGSPVEEACAVCGFVDPIVAISPSETLFKVSSTFMAQWRSANHEERRDTQIEQFKREIKEAGLDAANDVSQLRKQVEELRRSSEFYRTLVETYRNNEYTISLRDHAAEADARTEAAGDLWGLIACPVETCSGRVFKKTQTCTLCASKICFECFSVMNETHVCDDAMVQTAKNLVDTCIPCPMCLSVIHKIDGCDQMFCTKCTHSFDFKSGVTVSREHLHNPHFHEFQANRTEEDNTNHNSWLSDIMQSQRERASGVVTKPRMRVDNGWFTHVGYYKDWDWAEEFTEGCHINFRTWWTSVVDTRPGWVHAFARRVPTSIEIPDRFLVLDKINAIEHPEDDSAQAKVINLIFAEKNTKAKRMTEWILFSGMIRELVDLNNYLVAQYHAKAYDDNKRMRSIVEVVEIIVGRYTDVFKVTSKGAVVNALIKLARKRSNVPGAMCCVCVETKRSVTCVHCSKQICQDCLRRWWGSDRCKVHVSMPCCNKSAWNQLCVLHPASNMYKDLSQYLWNALEQEEESKRYRYAFFVENKRHADQILRTIDSTEKRVDELQQQIRQIQDGGEKKKEVSNLAKRVGGAVFFYFGIPEIHIAGNTYDQETRPMTLSSLEEFGIGPAAYQRRLRSYLRAVDMSVRLRLQKLWNDCDQGQDRDKYLRFRVALEAFTSIAETVREREMIDETELPIIPIMRSIKEDLYNHDLRSIL